MLLPEQLPAEAQFSTDNPENLILVENRRTGVLIRAARDNFSSPRKSFFIRELAAEGYIPGRYEGLGDLDAETNLNWVVDRSWLRPSPALKQRTDRFMLRLLGFSFLFWLAILALAFMAHP